MLCISLLTLSLLVATTVSKQIHPKGHCPTNNFHVVSQNETCQSIAVVASVSTGILQALNSLNAECTDLQANSTICLPGACTTYLFKAGDTCAQIATANNNMTLSTFYQNNPTIYSANCSNLLSGVNVCLTQPAGPALNIPPFSAHDNATASNNSTNPNSGGMLAPETAADCPKVHRAQTGDDCRGIAATNNLSVAWFEAQNPPINAGCTNLVAGILYCVQQEGDDHTVKKTTRGEGFVGRRHAHAHPSK